MATRLIVSGGDTNKDLEGYVARGIDRSNATALGVAVAYVSVYGAEFLRVRLEMNAEFSTAYALSIFNRHCRA